jgi:hypothetical protein
MRHACKPPPIRDKKTESANSRRGEEFFSGLLELCASRGLTLDATLGQCVTPKSAPQLPPQVVQVQPPPAAPVHSQQGQRAAPLVQIESDATINPELKRDVAQMDELAHFVRASGYRCDSISALRPLPTSNGFKLACNHSTYKYEIEDKAAPS